MNIASAVETGVSARPLCRRVARVQLTLALSLLALGIRCLDLGARPLWLDEAFTAFASGHSWQYLWTVLPTYEAHPPFYYSVMKLWRMAFGDSVVALRALSVLFGVLLIPIVMASALELERMSRTRRPLLRAGVAGFLAACSPMLLVLGQEARPYPMLTFAYGLAILGFLRLMRCFGEGKPGDWRSWLLLGAGTELILWSHSLGLLYAISLALALAPAWLKLPMIRARLFRGIGVGTAVLLCYLPGLLLVMSRAHDWGENWLQWHPFMLLQLFVLYSVPVEFLSVISAVGGLGMLLLIKRALTSAVRSHGWNCDRAIVLLWLGPPLLAAVISMTFVPVFLARTLVGTLVPAYLAIGGAAARGEGRERSVLAAVVGISLLVTAFQVAMRVPAERWDLVASYLQRNVRPADQIWVYPSDSALPLDRLVPELRPASRLIPAPFPTLGVKGPMRAGWPAMVSVTREQANKLAADPSLRTVPVIWLLTRQSEIFDPAGDMPNALAASRVPGEARDWGYIRVRPYYRR